MRKDASITVAMNMVPVGVAKAVADETVFQEPEPDVAAAIARNISTESKTNVKAEGYEDPENTSLETFKLKLVAKLEKLIHGYNVDNAIMIDKHGFDKEHYYCVLAKVLVIIIVNKPMDMPDNFPIDE